MTDDVKPKKTFVVCESCGTLYRVEVEKAENRVCTKCQGALVPLRGDVPHDQVATVLYLRNGEVGPQGPRVEPPKDPHTLPKPPDQKSSGGGAP